MVKKVTKKKSKNTGVSPRNKIKSSDYGFLGFIKENKGLYVAIEQLGNDFLKTFPTEEDPHFFSHTYSYRISSFRGHLCSYMELYNYFDISLTNFHTLEQEYWSLSNPSANSTKKDFLLVFENLLRNIKKTDPMIYERLKLLSRIECIRLDEAMNCLDAECNLSSVVMSVSAVEHRLHKLILKKNKTIYKKDFEKSTLGGIIALFKKDLYIDKKYQSLKKILPDKHKPLLEMLNTYRIFSAHPKDVVITNQVAKSILSLSFSFLIDNDLQVE